MKRRRRYSLTAPRPAAPAGAKGKKGSIAPGAANRLFALALIAAAAGVAAITMYATFGREPEPTPIKPLHYQCVECKHEFQVDPRSLGEEQVEAGGMAPLVCPACGQKAAYPQEQCPQCHTYFLPPRNVTPGAGDGKAICPKCHTDLDQWLLRNVARRSGK